MIGGRLLAINWGLIAAFILTLAVAVPVTNFSIAGGDSAVATTCAFAIFLGVASLLVLRRGFPRWPHMAHAANVVAQILVCTLTIPPLTYIAAAANFPLQDQTLYAIDRLAALDWRSYLHIVDDNRLGSILRLAYTTFLPQAVLVPILLGLFGNSRRCYEYAFVFMASLAITVTISAFIPALPTYEFFNVTPPDYLGHNPTAGLDQIVPHLLALRDGSMRMLRLGEMTGIVAFPSFHAVAAVIYVWALWPLRWIRPLAVLCNGLLLLATPIIGGHYFIDVLAGVTLALVCILPTGLLSSAKASVSQHALTELPLAA